MDGVGGTVDGVVAQVGPVQSSSSGYTYPMVVALPSSATGLFAGSSADMRISTGAVADVLAVPTSALQTFGSRTYALTLSGGTLTEKPIKVGMVGDIYTQVLSGLKFGQSVVLADYSVAGALLEHQLARRLRRLRWLRRGRRAVPLLALRCRRRGRRHRRPRRWHQDWRLTPAERRPRPRVAVAVQVPSPRVSDHPLPATGLIEDLPSRDLLRGVFHLLFGREPVLDDHGAYVRELESGALSPRQLVEWLIHSAEWSHTATMTELGPSLHYGRGVFIRSLPRATRILDIGGAAVGDPSGGLVLLGYPYRFDELVVVDLPSEDRHQIYQDDSRPGAEETALGPVSYRYHSMTDLSGIDAASFDLVYSGQSIEHVTRREADHVLAQVRRVLRPGGVLALDTPNRRLTRLQQDTYVDPDHKHEYAHGEMVAMIEGNGFVIERAVGINYGGDSVARGVFDPVELATKRGLFDEIEDCYLLAYVCRRPSRPALKPLVDRARWTITGPSALPRRTAGHLRRSIRA